MKRKGWIIVLVLALAGAGYLGYSLLNRQPDAQAQVAVETTVAALGPLRESVSVNGSLAPAREVALAFTTGGRVAEVLVDEGESVQAGQPLVRLDTDDLALQVAQAEASLASAQAQLDQIYEPATEQDLAEAESSYNSSVAQLRQTSKSKSADEVIVAQTSMKKAEAALAQAQAAYDQVKNRPNIAMLPESLDLQTATLDYENAKANYQIAIEGASDEDIQIAQASVDKAQAQLDRLKATPTAAEATIREAAVQQAQVSLDQARLKLEQATLHAPFAGEVTEVNVEVGGMASGAVVSLQDASTLQVDVRINENDLPRIAVGLPADIRVDAMPDVAFSGQVAALAVTAQTQSGVVLYPVTVALDAGQPGLYRLRVGMTSEVEIVVSERENVLTVPVSAVQREGTRDFVWQQRAGGYEKVFLTLGARAGEVVEVLDGLSEGDVISLVDPTAEQSQENGMSMFPPDPGSGNPAGARP